MSTIEIELEVSVEISITVDIVNYKGWKPYRPSAVYKLERVSCSKKNLKSLGSPHYTQEELANAAG